MKLLQLNATANWGSTGKIAEGIGAAAMRRGWQSFVAYGRYMNPSQSGLIKVGNKFNVYAHYARNRFLDGEGLGSKHATKKLIKQIAEINPDIIQLHNIHDHWLNYPILFDYLATIATPIVWTLHDCWPFTGGCYHFENIGCNGWQNMCSSANCPQSHGQAFRNFQLRKDVFAKVGSHLHIVSVSKWLEDYVQRSILNNLGASFRVINNGIDVKSAFRPTSIKRRMILGVSNIWPEYKGLGDFIKLRQILPEDIDIMIVGLSNKQISSLPQGIKGLTRTSSVVELAQLYGEASVFVNPTYNDSFPTVNLEALACGTPVVTYRTGGSPEAIDSSTGIVVEKGDVEGLRNAIMRIIEADEAFPAAACRERAVRCFNQETQFNKYIDLYEELLR